MVISKHDKSFIIFLKKIYNQRIFILAGANSFFKSGANIYFEKYIDKKNLKFFFKKKEYPDITELKKIISAIKKFKPKYILAVGGGSIMDYAKIACNINDVKNLNNIIKSSNKDYKKVAKLITIPTTAGSGSEVTSGAVVYINKIKFSVEGQEIVPDKFFLIPKLVINNSKSLKGTSGFDAISQSIESLMSRRSNSRSVNYAKKSLKISFKNYLSHITRPTLDNSLKMLQAANLAGKAISISKTTAPHAVSYPFTSHLGISHGNAVSLTLNEFLYFNYKNLKKSDVKFNLKKRFELLFKISGTKSIHGFLRYMQKLKNTANTEKKFYDMKKNKSKIVKQVLTGINIDRLSNNPVKLTKMDIKKIIESKFKVYKNFNLSE